MPCKKYEASDPLLAMTGHYQLFEDQGFKVGPSHHRITGGVGNGGGMQQKKKQGVLFGKSGLPNQMNLFPDKAVPDELVAKKKKKKYQAKAGAAEEIGGKIGTTAGAGLGHAAAARFKLPPKATAAVGAKVGGAAGRKLGRKVGKMLGDKYSVAHSEAVRIAFPRQWDQHQVNLAAALCLARG